MEEEDLSGRDSGPTSVVSKKSAYVHFAYRHHEVQDREEVKDIIEDLLGARDANPGWEVLLLVDFGSFEGGISVDAGIASDEGLSIEGFRSMSVGPLQVLSAVHRGDYSTIRDTYLEVYAEMRERGVIPRSMSRELVLRYDKERPGGSLIEIQWPLHDWTDLLASGVEGTLGPEARDHVMGGVEALTPETSREERFEWVKAALLRLDGISTEEQRYWAVSPCADRYPAWRIEKMRAIFQETGSVDRVLDEMKGDTEWYSTPYREGNLIYHTKVPYDREAWESAGDGDARRRAYCHCALVQDRLDETPPTYCYCGTGWVRQVWEGVLDRPIRVEVLKSLPAGDDECQFLIHLPEDVVGGE